MNTQMKMTTMQNRPTSVSEAVLQVELSDVRVAQKGLDAGEDRVGARGTCGERSGDDSALGCAHRVLEPRPADPDRGGRAEPPTLDSNSDPLPPAATVLFSERVIR